MEGTHYAVVATGQMVLTPSLSPTFDDDDDSDHANKKTTIMMMMMLVVALMRCEQMVSYVKYPLFDDIATMILLCRKSLYFISQGLTVFYGIMVVLYKLYFMVFPIRHFDLP